MSGFIAIAVAARGRYCSPTPASTCSTSFWSAASSVSWTVLPDCIGRTSSIEIGWWMASLTIRRSPACARQELVVLVLQAGVAPARGPVDAAEHLGRRPVARIHALDVRDAGDAVDRLAVELQRQDRLGGRGRHLPGHDDIAGVRLGDGGEDLEHRHVQQRRHRLRHQHRIAALDQVGVGDDVGGRFRERQLDAVAIGDRAARRRDRHVGDLLADRGLLEAVGSHHARDRPRAPPRPRAATGTRRRSSRRADRSRPSERPSSRRRASRPPRRLTRRPD